MAKFLVSMALFAGLLAAAGCGRGGPPPAEKPGKETPNATPDDDLHGWWCVEHGVREDDCSMCSAKVAKEYQAKGDWCKDHNRAKSQCFICDPSLREKFAGEYRAKFGKEPPEATDNMPAKKP